MISGAIKIPEQKLSRAKKEANDKQWFKENLDLLDTRSFSNSRFTFSDTITPYKRKKVNYDLYNNIIDKRDFEYVCSPYGAEAGELPAELANRDIVSAKIKALEGLELKRPFSWKIFAVNEEATTRIEQEAFSKHKEYVISQILKPIRESIEQQKLAETQGKELSPEQQNQIKQQIEQELAAKTPIEVKRYMEREHQDPAEALAHQLMEYGIQEEKVKMKFNKGWKHANLSGEEVYYVGIENGEPRLSVVNPLYFDFDRGSDNNFVEDGEWAIYEWRLTPSEVVARFNELTDTEITEIYNFNTSASIDDSFTFDDRDNDNENYRVRVLHGVWKSLRRIGFLSYKDENGEIQEKIVNEDYKMSKFNGDLTIEWRWIPECYEGYKIGNKIYTHCRAVVGQFKDLDNLYRCKLPYIGGCYDADNSISTCTMDRIKSYQYYYNIILYRIELMMASDKGKILLMNIGAIPKSHKMTTELWHYYAEASKIAWVNPNEEGNRNSNDVTLLAKELDMSLASDIQKYINMAEYIKQSCGRAVGIPDEMEGQITPNQSVSNVRQTLVQGSNILEPAFEFHNTIKGNVLEAFNECQKVAYSTSKAKKLNYILDDLSRQIIDIDSDLLCNSTYGIFVANSSTAYEAKEAIKALSQAAMQNQRIDMSDIVKILRTEGVQEAEELLLVSEKRKSEELHKQQLEMQQIQSQDAEKQRQYEREMKNFDRETTLLVEKEKTAREIQKQTILALGFSEEKDADKDGRLDVMEVMKQGVDAEIEVRKQQLEEQKFKHDVEVDKEKLSIDRQKAKKSN